MELIIKVNGNAHCIYDESIPIRSLGALDIQRASHVEPDDTGDWIADLSPVDGPRLGPFADRTDALKAEVEWLETNWL